jgi:hypothetical protein
MPPTANVNITNSSSWANPNTNAKPAIAAKVGNERF